MKKYLLLSVTVILSFLLSLAVCLSVLTQTAGNTQNITVVLDAGHGGIDGGVTGKKTGVKESEINLAIVKKLQAELTQAGINTVLTRKTDAGLYGLATKGFKRRDMLKRKEIIEKAAPSAVVSIHQNSYRGSSRRGGQVFYRKDSETGELLASEIQNCLNEMPQAVQKTTPLVGDYYMVNCTEYASVICECGFLNNEEDEALLITEEYQKALAEAIFKGIVAYLSKPAVKG